jgi:hypothetical protein
MSALTTFAACTSTAGQVCLDTLPQTQATGGAVQTVIQIVIGVLGAVALLIITIAGLQYVLSEGDPQKAARAKNAIIYAVVGLVIAILAQAIVTFVAVRTNV